MVALVLRGFTGEAFEVDVLLTDGSDGVRSITSCFPTFEAAVVGAGVEADFAGGAFATVADTRGDGEAVAVAEPGEIEVGGAAGSRPLVTVEA